ncbi:MAG: hypothetical protein ACO4AI_06610, partial [Prochlorothrix sp.]
MANAAMTKTPTQGRRSQRPWPWQMMLSVLMYGFMYLPILVLEVFSVNQSPYPQWQGISLKWYGHL